MSTADRSYPIEPRVGVGVVILRPGPLQSQDTEVSRFEGGGQCCQQQHPCAVQILLIRRGKAPSKGLWSFPGGSQELGKSA